jgi:hypothetical protein
MTGTLYEDVSGLMHESRAYFVNNLSERKLLQTKVMEKIKRKIAASTIFHVPCFRELTNIFL